MDWFAATLVPGDLFGEGAKGEKVDTENAVSKTLLMVCYAGFRAYSKDPNF